MLSAKDFVIVATVAVISLAGRAEADLKCETNFGHCQYMSQSCSGTYLINLCNGPYERKCCLPMFNDTRCHARDGKCQSTSATCTGGSYLIGMCGGPAARRCCVSDQVYNDEKCHQKKGQCRSNNYCTGGSYVSGLCGGPANRRCCIPHVTKKGCSPKAELLACELLSSTNVLFLNSHSTSATDKPFANLRDMCEGRQATRSTDRCNIGCKDPTSSLVCVHKKVLEYLTDLQRSGRIVVEELTGACHKKGCGHQWGRSVDLSRDGRIMDYIERCQDMGGRATPYENVLHCQF